MSNREVLERALQCFNDPPRRHDYFLLYSDDIVLHGYQGVEPGLPSVKQFYNAFWEVFPDSRVMAQEVIEENDALVVRHVTTGTHQKAFKGVAPTGQKIERQVSASCTSGMANALRDGLDLTHCWYYVRSGAPLLEKLRPSCHCLWTPVLTTARHPKL